MSAANNSPICLFMWAPSWTKWTIHQRTLDRSRHLLFSCTSSLHQRAESVCWCVNAETTTEPSRKQMLSLVLLSLSWIIRRSSFLLLPLLHSMMEQQTGGQLWLVVKAHHAKNTCWFIIVTTRQKGYNQVGWCAACKYWHTCIQLLLCRQRHIHT